MTSKNKLDVNLSGNYNFSKKKIFELINTYW